MVSTEKAIKLAKEQEVAMNKALLVEKGKFDKSNVPAEDSLVKASRKRKALSL
ncbi:MAG: hypothetical protein JXQ96_06610 [Cyclobacteriaceae bacterium]